MNIPKPDDLTDSEWGLLLYAKESLRFGGDVAYEASVPLLNISSELAWIQPSLQALCDKGYMAHRIVQRIDRASGRIWSVEQFLFTEQTRRYLTTSDDFFIPPMDDLG